MKENFEKAVFEISGDSWEIDDWYKKSEVLAMHRGLTMSERDNVSYVERIIESIKTLDSYGVRVAHDVCIKGALAFKYINGQELAPEFNKSEEAGISFFTKTRRKMCEGIEFWHVETITEDEYNAGTALEGVA